MTQYMGSMFTGISQYLIGKSTRKFALLIIDEQQNENELSELTVNQVKTIAFANTNRFKIVVVEINQSMEASKAKLTRQALARHLPHDTITFYKTRLNAFGVIDKSGIYPC